MFSCFRDPGCEENPGASRPEGSSSDNTGAGYLYDVFLSFRGGEGGTRYDFADHLYKALEKAGIHVFRDKEELDKGEEIGKKLLEAIDQSKISIPIFCKGYASSKWCLNEAAHMLKCKHKILPVFYNVAPNQVRNQEGDDYREAFQNHKSHRRNRKFLKEWRDALNKIGQLTGWDLTLPNRYEADVVDEIVSEVLKQLGKPPLCVADYLVGVDDHVVAVMDLLGMELSDVIVVGICGMGGVGKTTIAKLVFNQLVNQFDFHSFISNIRDESSKSKGMESLQRQLIYDILKHWEDIPHVDKGNHILKERFHKKKVLILLDDVDNKEQLNDLLPTCAGGSRIIVTTRNEDVLDKSRDHIYRVKELNEADAFRLFCKHAFGMAVPVSISPPFDDLSQKISKATGGLPLAIVVIASHLSTKLNENLWKEAIDWLAKHHDIHNRLKISYDRLSGDAKHIFLDIACLYAGMDSRVLVHMWKACDLSTEFAIQELCQRSLIKLGEDHVVWMHDIIKDLGRELVRQEGVIIPENRSRLWRHKDAIQLLQSQGGTDMITAICLDIGTEQAGAQFQRRSFEKLRMLQFLDLGDCNLEQNFQGCLQRLKWLSWHGQHHLLNIPSDLMNLVVLKLSKCSIPANWIGWSLVQVLEKLEVLNLTGCSQLRITPQFPSLKRLILEDCIIELVDIDPSLGHLTTLEFLSLKNCSQLERMPVDLSSSTLLTELVIDGTLIRELPISAGMSLLTTLSAKHCTNLHIIPQSLRYLKRLQHLLLNDCHLLEKIPSCLGELWSLEELNISHTHVSSLPDSIGELGKLRVLDISHTWVSYFPRSLNEIQNLEELNASECHRLRCEIDLSKLQRLRIIRLDRTNVRDVLLSSNGIQTLDLKGCNYLLSLHVLQLSLVNLKLTCVLYPTRLTLSRLLSLKKLEILNCQWLNEGFLKDIDCLSRLRELSIEDCHDEKKPRPRLQPCTLQDLPRLPSSLRKLQLKGLCSLKGLPNLSNLKKLVTLSVINCHKVKEIAGLDGLVSLQTLQINSPYHSLKLKGFETLSSLTFLSLRGCSFETLPALPQFKQILHITVEQPEQWNQIGIQGWRRMSPLRSSTSGVYNNEDTMVMGDLDLLKVFDISSDDQVDTALDPSLFPIVESLRLVHLKSSTSFDAVSKLATLKKLEISNYRMQRLPLLRPLLELKHLKLKKCELIDQIQELAGLPSLEILEISFCHTIRSLSEDLSSCSRLKKLELSYCNQLQDFSALTGILSLESLDIHGFLEIERFLDLNSFAKLKELKVRDCRRLKEIYALGRESSLEVLHLSDCRALKDINGLTNLHRLREFRLQNCRICNFPTNTMLESLAVLQVSNCDAIYVMDLYYLQKVKELDLSCCRNLSIVSELEELVSLEVMNLSSCKNLKMLPNLSKLEKLRKLDLSHCDQLVEIPGIRRLVSLESLNVVGCEKLVLPDLSHLPYLKELLKNQDL